MRFLSTLVALTAVCSTAVEGNGFTPLGHGQMSLMNSGSTGLCSSSPTGTINVYSGAGCGGSTCFYTGTKQVCDGKTSNTCGNAAAFWNHHTISCNADGSFTWACYDSRNNQLGSLSATSNQCYSFSFLGRAWSVEVACNCAPPATTAAATTKAVTTLSPTTAPPTCKPQGPPVVGPFCNIQQEGMQDLLCNINQNGVMVPNCYRPGQYVCTPEAQLCPMQTPFACSTGCYSPYENSCTVNTTNWFASSLTGAPPAVALLATAPNVFTAITSTLQQTIVNKLNALQCSSATGSGSFRVGVGNACVGTNDATNIPVCAVLDSTKCYAGTFGVTATLVQYDPTVLSCVPAMTIPPPTSTVDGSVIGGQQQIASVLCPIGLSSCGAAGCYNSSNLYCVNNIYSNDPWGLYSYLLPLAPGSFAN